MLATMRPFLNIILRTMGQLPLAVLQLLGTAIGWLMTLLPTRRAGRVGVNLRLCLPDLSDAERRRLGRQALINLGRTTLETPRLWFGPTQQVKQLFREVLNEELFEQAKAAAARRKTGVIVLSPHLNWEVAVLYLGLQGPSTFLYKPQNPNVEALVRAGRGRFGTRFVHAIPGNVREQLQERLANGHTVLMLPDQDPPRERGVFAPFFGVAAHSPSIVGRLIEHSQAPVVLLQVERLGLGRGFKLRFLPAPAGIDSRHKETSVAAVNQAMETCIRYALPQYMWNVPRFRRRPPGEDKVYSV